MVSHNHSLEVKPDAIYLAEPTYTVSDNNKVDSLPKRRDILDYRLENISPNAYEEVKAPNLSNTSH